MDNRSEKTISRAIFGSSFDFHLIYEPIEPCQPRIFDFRFSPLSFRPETNTLLLPDHQRMDNRSENPIRRSIIDLSPDSPFIYEPIEPCHPLIFCLSALLSFRNKFILPGPPISRPPEPRKVHRKLHWREALRKESLKSTFLFSIWTFSSKEQSLRSDLAAWFGKDGPNYPKIQIESLRLKVVGTKFWVRFRDDGKLLLLSMKHVDPTPFRALPGDRRPFGLCRCPPVGFKGRYSWLFPDSSLFGLDWTIDGMIWLVFGLNRANEMWHALTIRKLECG